jgi:hypothetical protein
MVALRDGATDDQQRVKSAVRERAEIALAGLGFGKFQLVTIQDCVSAVRNR